MSVSECVTCMRREQICEKVSVRERQGVAVTCECDIEHDWELSGVCEGNGDGGIGANQG